MATDYVLAFDMGTTNIKAALIDQDGNVAYQGRGKVKPWFPQDSWVEVDPEQWWDVICSLTKSLLESSGVDGSSVKGLAVASAACGVTVFGRDCNPLRRSIVWLDNRASAEAEAVMANFGGRDAFFEATGMILCGKDAVMKHLWLMYNEPEIYENAKWLLDDAGYILYRATGKCVCSRANASAIALDLASGEWDENLLGALGLDPEKYPALVDSNEMVGYLTEQAAQEIGLHTGVAVFGGCTDIHGVELGSGCSKPGDSYFYLGTSGLIGIVCEAPQEPSLAATPLASAVPGKSFMMGTSEMTGGCIDWAVENLFKHEYDTLGKDALGYANKRLQETKPGADNLIFANWLYGERNPMMDEWARAGFINLSVTHNRDHMLRAVYEGCACQMVWIVNEIERLHGLAMPRLRVSGGGTLSANWMQIVADIANKPVDVIEDALAVVVKGVGYAALVGLGYLPGFDSLSDCVKIEKTYMPQPENAELYRKKLDDYIAMYSIQKDLFKRLNAPENLKEEPLNE